MIFARYKGRVVRVHEKRPHGMNKAYINYVGSDIEFIINKSQLEPLRVKLEMRKPIRIKIV